MSLGSCDVFLGPMAGYIRKNHFLALLQLKGLDHHGRKFGPGNIISGSKCAIRITPYSSRGQQFINIGCRPITSYIAQVYSWAFHARIAARVGCPDRVGCWWFTVVVTPGIIIVTGTIITSRWVGRINGRSNNVFRFDDYLTGGTHGKTTHRHIGSITGDYLHLTN